MANKALAKRQKMTIRVEPSQKALKARNQRVPGQSQQTPPGTNKKTPSLLERLLSPGIRSKTGKEDT